MRLWFACSILLATSAVAHDAQGTIAGAWFDGAGNEVFLPAKSFTSEPLTPASRPVADIVALFDEACVRAPVSMETARPAIDARASWGFRYLDADAGTGPGSRLDGWQAMDVSVSSQPRAWPLAECNVTAARRGADPFPAVAADVSRRLGAQPDRQYRPRMASGGVLDGQAARWSVQGPSGKLRQVYLSSYTDRMGGHTLHLGLTEMRPK